MKAGEGIREMMPSIIGDADTPREKMRRLYEWVRDEIRYVAVSIGIGGYQPHFAEDILNHRYGDCKDMTALLCAMAGEAGLDAFPVLISTWQNGYPDTALATMLQFNHVIAGCALPEGDTLYLDATQKGCPFPMLPWYDQGLPALAVGKKGETELIMTGRVPDEANTETLFWEIRPEGSEVHGSLLYRLEGASATGLREELLYSSARTHREWFERFLAERCPGARLDSSRIAGLSPVEDPLEITLSFTTGSFFTQHPAGKSFSPGTLSGFHLDRYFLSRDRIHPVRFPCGSVTVMRIRFHIPDGWEVRSGSDPETLTSPFGDARLNIVREGRILGIESDVRIGAGDIAPEDFPEFRAFLEGVRRNEMHGIDLVPSTPDPAGGPG